jgi:hypothetical protein
MIVNQAFEIRVVLTGALAWRSGRRNAVHAANPLRDRSDEMI